MCTRYIRQLLTNFNFNWFSRIERLRSSSFSCDFQCLVFNLYSLISWKWLILINFQTGTLTEDGLDMWGVVPSEYGHFKPPAKQLDTLKSGNLLYAMVTCHSLTIIDNKIAGDPLDLKVWKNIYVIFEFCKTCVILLYTQFKTGFHHQC